MIYKINNCSVISDDPRISEKNSLVYKIENGISEVLEDADASDIKEFDGGGCLVFPAFTDIGCSFFDPENPSRDTLASASAAANAGGYRRLLTLSEKGALKDGDKRVSYATAAKSAEQILKSGTDIYFSYHLSHIGNDLYDIFDACAKTDSLYISAGINEKKVQGSLSDGTVSKMLGIKGITKFEQCAEISRELFAAYETGCRLHIRSISCKEELEMIRTAKKAGVKVTCGVSPFHLAFSDSDSAYYGNMCKLLPPLRSKADRQALIDGIEDIDCICSLHTPLTASEKNQPTELSPFGLCSIENTFSAAVTYMPQLLHKPRLLSSLMADNPSKIIGDAYSLCVGSRADFILVDPSIETVVTKNSLRSKSANTPFLGQTLLAGQISLYLNGMRS